MAKGNRPAGGIGSRVVTKQSVRTGAPARGVNPGHVAQQGTALGNKVMESSKRLNPVEPKLTTSPRSVPLGNQTALSAGQVPGSGRTVSSSGSQDSMAHLKADLRHRAAPSSGSSDLRANPEGISDVWPKRLPGRSSCLE